VDLEWHASCYRRPTGRARSMADLAYVATTLIFFAIAWGYARACDRI
jgi:hypothetical protein